MACNGFNLCGSNNSCPNNTCMWTLIIVAAVFIWINCFGGCGCGCD